MAGETIHRYTDSVEAVVVPKGYVKCPECGGRGKLSKYDQGWRSVTHSPKLAAKRECWWCYGEGYVIEERG